jgi:hypothetical protein
VAWTPFPSPPPRIDQHAAGAFGVGPRVSA